MTGMVHDDYYNLAERIGEAFHEMDGEICKDLQENDCEYIEIWQEMMEKQKECPVIVQLHEGKGEITLSAEEHKALLWYFKLKHRLENIERLGIYYRGHADHHHILKKMKLI